MLLTVGATGAASAATPSNHGGVSDASPATTTGDRAASALQNHSLQVLALSAPRTVDPAGSATVTATVTNPGSANATERVVYRVDGNVVDDRTVTLAPGESRAVSFDLNASELAPGEHFHGVYTAEDGRTARIDVSASFEVDAFDVPESVPADESATVSVLVSNPNEFEDEQSVELRLDGRVLERRTVEVPGNEGTSLSFELPTTGLDPGEQFVSVFTRDRGAVRAVEVTEPVEPPAPNASVTFDDQTTNGSAVSVSAAENDTAPFYVAVWSVDESTGGLDEILGVVAVNDTGATDLPVGFEEPLTENASLVAAVHPDADGDPNTTDPVVNTILASDAANVTVEAEPPAPSATVTFDDQTSDGSAVSVADASNATAPFYVAVWTVDANGTPDQLLGFTRSNDSETTDVPVAFEEPLTESATLVAAVHPDADGDANTTDPDVETILASDAANVTVEAEAEPSASVTFEDQTTNGSAVSVTDASNATAPFYVAVWTLDANGTPDQLLGFARSNETGATGVSVAFEEPLTENATLVAAVHPDADGDANTTDPDVETILASDVANVTVEAEPPAPSATVTFEDQTSGGRTVLVSSTTLSEGGFVAIHEVTDTGAVGRVIGTSEYLPEGEHSNVSVSLFDVPGAEFDETALDGNATLVAMPHLDTNGNETYDFVATDGAEDGPYVRDGGAVTDAGNVTVEDDGGDDGGEPDLAPTADGTPSVLTVR